MFSTQTSLYRPWLTRTCVGMLLGSICITVYFVVLRLMLWYIVTSVSDTSSLLSAFRIIISLLPATLGALFGLLVGLAQVWTPQWRGLPTWRWIIGSALGAALGAQAAATAPDLPLAAGILLGMILFVQGLARAQSVYEIPVWISIGSVAGIAAYVSGYAIGILTGSTVVSSNAAAFELIGLVCLVYIGAMGAIVHFTKPAHAVQSPPVLTE